MTTIIILSEREKAIFDAIQTAAINGETTPTLDRLRLAANCGRDAAGALVKSLQQKGFIRIGGEGSNYRVYHITGTYHSTVRAEKVMPVSITQKQADMDKANRKHVAAICRYFINHGKPHWRKNLIALGELA